MFFVRLGERNAIQVALFAILFASSLVQATENDTTTAAVSETSQPANNSKNDARREEDASAHDEDNFSSRDGASSHEARRLFVVELLKMLHEQYHGSLKVSTSGAELSKKEDRQSSASSSASALSQLLGAIGADGDLRRLIDWAQNSFNLASIGELTTQFVVSKLASVNCAAILTPDREETLVPRFLLFNEHFVDVPFELSPRPSATECLTNGRFDPKRKTVVLIHGYLTGYTLVDGLTNIKNRLLDLNKLVSERAASVIELLHENVAATNSSSKSRLFFVEDIEAKLKQQQHNVIIVDWFNGANPVPRSRYIRAAVNAQVVGQLIARFLAQMVSVCQTPASNIQIIAHSLGCHVAGFTGKAMAASGQPLGKITHLDPVGLCFGRLFSQPRFRLSPTDALDTQAVHVSLNLFDNPLDGAQSNFLVNGGRDQIGCGGQSELQNSTSSSIALLFDANTKFRPCSHVRALALFEDDLSSQPAQCQMVGYRCPTYERFLAGKCGRCDALNGQCRLMSMAPIIAHSKTLSIPTVAPPGGKRKQLGNNDGLTGRQTRPPPAAERELSRLVSTISNGSIAWLIDDPQLNQKIVSTIASSKPDLILDQRLRASLAGEIEFENQSQQQYSSNEITKRVDRRLSGELVQAAIDRIRLDTRHALAGGLLSLRGLSAAAATAAVDTSPKLQRHKSLGRLRGAQSRPDSQPSSQIPHLTHEELVATPDPPDPVPLGGQANPKGSVNMPLYFVGTGPISSYCINYYQFRMLISESRISRLLRAGSLAPNRSAQVGAFASIGGGGAGAGEQLPAAAGQRLAANQRDTLHLTVKLSDNEGRFFKGFTLVEEAKSLARVPRTAENMAAPESMFELTMLLNTTRPEPVRISESIVSFYFHGIFLADSIEINYMSNISPLVRARFSSVLCPMAINDKHQLVRYIECDKLAAAARRR